MRFLPALIALIALPLLASYSDVWQRQAAAVLMLAISFAGTVGRIHARSLKITGVELAPVDAFKGA